MKLNCELEFVEIDGRFVAIPINGNEKCFRGSIRMTPDSKELLEIIQKAENAQEVLDEMGKRHPEETRQVIGKQVCDFLNILIKKGILEPDA